MRQRVKWTGSVKHTLQHNTRTALEKTHMLGELNTFCTHAVTNQHIKNTQHSPSPPTFIHIIKDVLKHCVCVRVSHQTLNPRLCGCLLPALCLAKYLSLYCFFFLPNHVQLACCSCLVFSMAIHATRLKTHTHTRMRVIRCGLTLIRCHSQ